jgi:hypothetical protein
MVGRHLDESDEACGVDASCWGRLDRRGRSLHSITMDLGSMTKHRHVVRLLLNSAEVIFHLVRNPVISPINSKLAHFSFRHGLDEGPCIFSCSDYKFWKWAWKPNYALGLPYSFILRQASLSLPHVSFTNNGYQTYQQSSTIHYIL